MENFCGGAQIGVLVERRFDLLFIADQQESKAVVLAARNGGAFDHDAHALIPAHRIYGDSREGHLAFT